MIHGFTGSAKSWAPIAEGLADEGFEPKAIDLPGHGAAARAARVDLDAALGAIAGAVDGPRDLVGYSMGGRVALHYALAAAEGGRVVRRLVLESSSPGIDDPDVRAARRGDDEELARRIESDGVEAFVDAWEALPLFASQRALPESVRRAQRIRRLENDPAGLAAALRGLGTGALPSLWARLESVQAPTLLIVGARDEKFVEVGLRMADLLPDARVEIVAGSGHAVHLERPEAWIRAVASFLST